MQSETAWKYVIAHYEQLIFEGFDYHLQLNLIEKVVNSTYAKSLFPNTSHFALIVSRVENFNESLDFPSICIEYGGDEKFIINYSPKLKQTHNILKRMCNYQDVWSFLESLFLRQKIESGL